MQDKLTLRPVNVNVNQSQTTVYIFFMIVVAIKQNKLWNINYLIQVIN